MELSVNSTSPYELARHRHRAPAPRSRGRLLSPIIAAAAVLLLVTGAGVALSQGGIPTLFPANASGGPGCTDPVSLLVVADESIAPALTQVAADFDATSTTCVATDVRSQASGDTAALLASNALTGADAWVPDSSLWLARMATTAEALGRSAPNVTAGDSVATTPVVFGAPAARSVEFAADTVGWSTLLSGTIGGLVPDPESSAASLAGLASLTAAAPADNPRIVPSTMIELGKTIPASRDEAIAAALAAPRPTVVVTTEQEVVSHNLSNPEVPLLAIYPVEGSSSLDYPFVRVPQKAGEDAETRAMLLDEFERRARLGDAFYAAQGFRDHKGGGEVESVGVLAWSTTPSPPADAVSQVEALSKWSTLTRRSRMLIAIDVSGSMLEPAGGGLRRIEVYQRAAGGALGRYAGETHMGVWVFSTDRPGGKDYEEVAPVAALSDPAHLQQIVQVTQTLPQYIRGDTGLYDTILDGVTKMHAEYTPGMVNSMVIITDGRNDDKGSISLDALLQRIAEMNDPLKPVPVILIGFGPDTDLESMQRIAEATGGEAYSAFEPNDLDKVFVDALTQRTCRPNC
ncbi:VWA domain-containing protein [Salinibacterium hongtaonis]|uniref:VWA domain-containing protein n=1 Tax=Homoserinimonas hongtaonis TaxID=2079791 RepID=A0A2U1T093_9MICO|nr:VWA domain-containing protein [Salinibacterium hongtaonis]PWB97193.1 VWA domain-containing protein [Salinibacterium hongtaonis]